MDNAYGELSFDIPVVLILFKRIDKPLAIIGQLKKIMPSRIYLLSDAGRSREEQDQVEKCRLSIETAIDWDCEVIKKYADQNLGVYGNIAGGAKWVFEREDMAIFLEDDNLPDLSFFKFCKEMLIKYKVDTRVLWVCGTNYFETTKTRNSESYFFSMNMFPCGWASWSDKFCKFYDGTFSLLDKPGIKKIISTRYLTKALYRQDLQNWNDELRRIGFNGKPASWDHQMSLSLRANGLYGIVPKSNLIKNIGVDEASIHGGVSMSQTMTRRFCEIPLHALEFPLKHPAVIYIDKKIEADLERYITYPASMRLKIWVSLLLKKILRLSPDQSVTVYIKRLIRK